MFGAPMETQRMDKLYIRHFNKMFSSNYVFPSTPAGDKQRGSLRFTKHMKKYS